MPNNIAALLSKKTDWNPLHSFSTDNLRGVIAGNKVKTKGMRQTGEVDAHGEPILSEVAGKVEVPGRPTRSQAAKSLGKGLLGAGGAVAALNPIDTASAAYSGASAGADMVGGAVRGAQEALAKRMAGALGISEGQSEEEKASLRRQSETNQRLRGQVADADKNKADAVAAEQAAAAEREAKLKAEQAAAAEREAKLKAELEAKSKAEKENPYNQAKEFAGQAWDKTKELGGQAVDWVKENPYKAGGGAAAVLGGILLYNLMKRKRQG